VNGLPAAYATLRESAQGNNAAVDVTVYAYQFDATHAFHFMTMTPGWRGQCV
jgi:hypothetical protein